MRPKKILKFFHLSSRTGLGFLAAFCMLVTAWPTPLWLAVGAGIALLGGAIRFWASGSLEKDEVLARTGPYAIVRNPLYLGSILIATGFALANRNPIFICIAAVLLGLLYRRTISKEERKLKASFGEEFEAYRREVPVLFPVPWRLPKWRALWGGFSVRQALRNQEGEVIFGIAGLLGALAIPAFTGGVGLFRVVISIGMVAFIAIRAGLFPIIRSDSKSRGVQVLQFLFSRKKYTRIRTP